MFSCRSAIIIIIIIMLKAKVEWLEVRLGLRVTKRLLDKNRVETLDDNGKSLKQLLLLLLLLLLSVLLFRYCYSVFSM